MKIGITSKLFLAVLGASVVVAVAMGVAVRQSFERGFLDYLNEREEQAVRTLALALAESYAEHGGWDFLRGDPRKWRDWLRLARDDTQERPAGAGAIVAGPGPTPDPARGTEPPGRRTEPPDWGTGLPGRGTETGSRPDSVAVDGRGRGDAAGRRHVPEAEPLARARRAGEPPRFGPRPRLFVLDAQGRPVAGRVVRDPAVELRPVVVDGRTVGWLGGVRLRGFTRAADLRFQEQQRKASWVIVGLAALLSALVAVLLARVFLAPLKRLADATHRLASGDFTARVAVASRDELGRLAEDFNRLAGTLEKTERMRRDFIADISHELRTPLAVLRGELEAVEDGVRPLTPATLHSLQAEVAALTKLVDDLYELALADAGAPAYRKTAVDAAALLRQALGAFRERLAARGLSLETGLPDDGTLPVLADPNRLTQVFHNLLENAARYVEHGGRLRVAGRRDGEIIRIDFHDSGPGVPPELTGRLFERFFRVEGSRSREGGGAGLGLAISRGVVEAHGGSIAARPSPLGGLWIEIILPLRRA